jgi:hypothetical protein
MTEELPPAGYRIADFCKATAISDQMIFLLWREGRGPNRVKVGRRLTVITEQPEAFLKRLAETPPPRPVIKPLAAFTPPRPATIATTPKRPPRAAPAATSKRRART